MKAKLIFPALLLLLVSSCTQKAPVVSDWNVYVSEYNAWQENRLERLKSNNGWLNLAGLLWLDNEINTFGSDPSNDLVFPDKFVPFGGEILIKDSIPYLVTTEDAGIMVNGNVITEMPLQHDQEKNTTIMELGSFRWFIIKRGDRFAIRLRDLEHPRISSLDHIPAYPFSKNWVVEANFVPYDSVLTVQVPTAIDNFYEYYKVPGELKFKVKGKTQTLLPFKSANGFFLIVGDQTNGVDTYGAGRFLSTGPVENGKVIIDFNRAYNPPCAFSPFATCPLPPLENILNIKIEAGEKGVHLP